MSHFPTILHLSSTRNRYISTGRVVKDRRLVTKAGNIQELIVFQASPHHVFLMRVLIVRLDHLGDVLLTTPLVARRSRGDTRFMCWCEKLAPLRSSGTTRWTTHAVEQVCPDFPKDWSAGALDAPK